MRVWTVKTALLTVLGVGIAALGVYAGLHPYGARTALGIWPVPDGTPWTYQLWSGLIPALTVASLFGAIISVWKLHNCHHSSCWRLGKHRVSGTPWCNTHVAEAQPSRTDSERLDEIISLLGELARSGRGDGSDGQHPGLTAAIRGIQVRPRAAASDPPAEQRPPRPS